MASNLNLSKANLDRASAPILAEQNTSFFTCTPNPTTGTFALAIASYNAGTNYALDIYNTSGSVVHNNTLKAQTENVTLAVPSGFYYVRLNTPAGVAVKKISVQAGAA